MTGLRDFYAKGHLTTAGYSKPTITGEAALGIQSLALGNKKEALLLVPQKQSLQPSALAVLLHGSGGSAAMGLSLLQDYAEENNIIILAPASQSYTWDCIVNEVFGPDAIFLDTALSFLFERYAIDPDRIAIGGFSDGASYALSVGLSNGGLFSHILAFSPGFYFTPEPRGKPKVFISHGTTDRVLPIGPCSRRIVSSLTRSGIEVEYHEFMGGHEIPMPISGEAVKWFLENAP